MKIQLKHSQQFPCRLSFPQLWRAVVVRNKDGSEGDGKPSFSANALILGADPQADKIEEIFEQVATEKWGAKAKNVLAMLRAKDRTCLHNGDYKADYDGYAGNWFITARSPTKPLILGRNKEELFEKDGRPYGGCYVNFSIDIYAQDNNWGQRLNATLRGVQFVQDGDAFAAGPPATPEEFDDLNVGAGEALA